VTSDKQEVEDLQLSVEGEAKIQKNGEYRSDPSLARNQNLGAISHFGAR
jgi:hypothetical protein